MKQRIMFQVSEIALSIKDTQFVYIIHYISIKAGWLKLKLLATRAGHRFDRKNYICKNVLKIFFYRCKSNILYQLCDIHFIIGSLLKYIWASSTFLRRKLQ
jgi:hypothetical protein